jgi:Protein of unknown function (DUF3122)
MKKAIISMILTVIIFFGVSFSYPESALAVIRTQQESPEVLLYQSRHSLQDNTGKSWQVILFKRVKNNEIQTINLRLAGFPKEIVFNHPESLTIIDSEGKVLQSEDNFAQKSPAPNVGEYNFQKVLSQLVNNQNVELILPINGNNFRSLMLPSQVLLEWQLLAE